MCVADTICSCMCHRGWRVTHCFTDCCSRPNQVDPGREIPLGRHSWVYGSGNLEVEMRLRKQVNKNRDEGVVVGRHRANEEV